MRYDWRITAVKARMTGGEAEEESFEVLAEQPHPPPGLRVKLDKGFESGVYCVWVEYDPLAERVGFEAARRKALAYAQRLHEQMGRLAGYRLCGIEDFSRSGDPRRKRDLEHTFLSFALTAHDGLWHDAAMKQHFQIAPLRADQEWDQHQAHLDARRRDRRREVFRQRLDTLLEGESFRHLDGPTRERLLAAVTDLVFPSRDRER
jgi:hypothetical protein